MKTLTELIGKPAMLEQTAEECAELGKACLKMSRYLRGENPVYTDEETLKENLEEELADVDICILEVLSSGIINRDRYVEWGRKKIKRMEERFNVEG